MTPLGELYGSWPTGNYRRHGKHYERKTCFHTVQNINGNLQGGTGRRICNFRSFACHRKVMVLFMVPLAYCMLCFTGLDALLISSGSYMKRLETWFILHITTWREWVRRTAIAVYYTVRDTLCRFCDAGVRYTARRARTLRLFVVEGRVLVGWDMRHIGRNIHMFSHLLSNAPLESKDNA